ncbi:MAG: lactate dehydrogenase [Erysipelotrichaceae bacterium]|nr:lactate dehydrogenase [Erysipelotrichaceae bacterium]
MKIFVYGQRPFDEAYYFEKYTQELGIEYNYTTRPFSKEIIDLATGYDAISISTTPVDKECLDRFKELGVKIISTRSIGYDHIDIEYAKSIGIKVTNVSYNSECVAEFTMMLLLMTLRKCKSIMNGASANDYTLQGLSGELLCTKTVGIIGTGKIGRTVLRYLKGFGCKVYAYSFHPDPTLGVEYLPLDELFTKCDVITLHTALTADTHHIINKEAIDKMPDGAVIINTARGGLIDTDALIDALESGKIGACGFDAIEDEGEYIWNDRKQTVLKNRRFAILRNMPNVLITPHIAFYTQETVSDMVRNSLLSCVLEEREEKNPWRIV